jgi:hypothetical protein
MKSKAGFRTGKTFMRKIKTIGIPRSGSDVPVVNTAN